MHKLLRFSVRFECEYFRNFCRRVILSDVTCNVLHSKSLFCTIIISPTANVPDCAALVAGAELQVSADRVRPLPQWQCVKGDHLPVAWFGANSTGFENSTQVRRLGGLCVNLASASHVRVTVVPAIAQDLIR